MCILVYWLWHAHTVLVVITLIFSFWIQIGQTLFIIQISNSNMAEGQLQQQFATICDQMQQDKQCTDSSEVRMHNVHEALAESNLASKDAAIGADEAEHGPLMSKGASDSSHQNAQGETIHKSIVDALNPEQASNERANERHLNLSPQSNVNMQEQAQMKQSQPLKENLTDMVDHAAKEPQNVKADTFIDRANHQNEAEDNVEEQNGESEESSNGAALNESGSKRSLRRTTRVKKAKNISEFIYFGKYNKELMKPKSYAKCNQQPSIQQGEEYSQTQLKSQQNVPKPTVNKRNTAQNCQQASSSVNTKKMGGKNQNNSPITDGIAPPQDNVRSQKYDKDLSNNTNLVAESSQRPEITDPLKATKIQNKDMIDNDVEIIDEMVQDAMKAGVDDQNHYIDQKQQVNIKQMDYCQTKKEQQNDDKANQQTQDQLQKSKKCINSPSKQGEDVEMQTYGPNQDEQMQNELNNTVTEHDASQMSQPSPHQNANGSQLVSVGRENKQQLKYSKSSNNIHKLDKSDKNSQQTNTDVAMKDESPSQDNKESGQSKSVAKTNDEKVASTSNSKPTRNNLRSLQGNSKEVPQNVNEVQNDQQELSKDKNQTKSKELAASQSDLRQKDKSVSLTSKKDKEKETKENPKEAEQQAKQQKPVYCICRTSDEQNMICCDICEEWYHFHCVGIKPEEITDYDNKPYYCKYSKKCIETQKKNQIKKAQAKENDDKKQKNDKKSTKQVEADQKSNNKKTVEQTSTDNQAQRQQTSNIDKKKNKNQSQKVPNTSTEAPTLAEAAQKRSSKEPQHIETNTATKNTKNQARSDTKNANKTQTTVATSKTDRKIKNDNPPVDSKAINSSTVNSHKKSLKDGKGSANGQQTVQSSQNQRSKTAAPQIQANNLQSQTNQKAKLTSADIGQNIAQSSNQPKNTAKLNKNEKYTNQLSQLDYDKNQTTHDGQDALFQSQVDKKQLQEVLTQNQQLLRDNTYVKQRGNSQIQEVVKRDGRPTVNKRKEKMVTKEIQHQQILKEKVINDGRVDEASKLAFKLNKTDDASDQMTQKMSQGPFKHKKLKDNRLDQSYCANQDQSLAHELKQSKKIGKERKFYGSYVQSGQRPLQGYDISSKPISYPPMFSFQTLGMTAPNILMSGGINNLISNIKQLNLQMSAAIIQAEKMSRLTKLSGASQQCCKCNPQASARNDSMVAQTELTGLKRGQAAQMNVAANNLTNFDEYSIDQLLQHADCVENQQQLEASLNTLLKRQKYQHENVGQSTMSQHQFFADKIPIEIEQIYQQGDSIMKDQTNVKGTQNGNQAQTYMPVQSSQQSRANQDEISDMQAPNNYNRIAQNIRQNKQMSRNTNTIPQNESGQIEQIDQKIATNKIEPNINLFKNGSSTKGYSSDDEERQKVANTVSDKNKQMTVHNNENQELEAFNSGQKEAMQSKNDGANYQEAMNVGGSNTRQPTNNLDAHMKEECNQQNYQQIHEFLQEVVSTDPQEFQTLAMALQLDEKEMEEEARVRLAEESDKTLAAQQDQESIRLMKQALLLEKILANFDDGNSGHRLNKVHAKGNMGERESQVEQGDTPSKSMQFS